MLQCLIYKQIYRFSRNVPELPSIFLINSPSPSPAFLKSFALLFLCLLHWGALCGVRIVPYPYRSIAGYPH